MTRVQSYGWSNGARRDDLNRHVRTQKYKTILAALDMSDAQPEISFDTVVETKGMQLIEEALGVNTQN